MKKLLGFIPKGVIVPVIIAAILIVVGVVGLNAVNKQMKSKLQEKETVQEVRSNIADDKEINKPTNEPQTSTGEKYSPTGDTFPIDGDSIRNNAPENGSLTINRIASNVDELPEHEHDHEYFNPTTDDYVIIGSNQRLKIQENFKIISVPVVRYELRCFDERGEVASRFHKYIFQNENDAKRYHEFQLKNNDVYNSTETVGYKKATAIRFDNLIYYNIDTFNCDYKDSLVLTLSKQWFYEELGQVYLYAKEHQIPERIKSQSEIALDNKYIPRISDDFLFIEEKVNFDYTDNGKTIEVPVGYEHYTFFDDYGLQIANHYKYICPSSEIAQILYQRIIDFNKIIPEENTILYLTVENNAVYQVTDMAKVRKIWESTIKKVTDVRTKDDLRFYNDNSANHYLSKPENFFLQHRSGYVPPAVEYDQNKKQDMVPNNTDNEREDTTIDNEEKGNDTALCFGYDWWDGKFETKEKEQKKSEAPIAVLSLEKSNSSFSLSLRVIDEYSAEECWLFNEYVMKNQLEDNVLNKKCISRANGDSNVCYLMIKPISKDKAKITILKEEQVLFEKEAIRVN